jgi:S-formylglutathione hydrolase FrmB
MNTRNDSSGFDSCKYADRMIRQSLPVLFLLIFTFGPFSTRAATVDTVSIYSPAMHKSFNCVVIQPTLKKKERSIPLPVVYLLHGYSGKYSNWIIRVPDLSSYADQYRILIVCPDGGYSGWYFDSPIDSNSRYETYIGAEVPAYIDQHYNTIKDRRGRAITGLSMGGHGGLLLAFRHADRFGAGGSMSGALDINRPPRTSYEISKLLGDTIRYAGNWHDNSVTNIIEKYPRDSLKLVIDCGTEDFFYPINRNLHEKMLRLKIPHDYIERPGKHDWVYWRTAVKYQLLFFREYFNSNKTH